MFFILLLLIALQRQRVQPSLDFIARGDDHVDDPNIAMVYFKKAAATTREVPLLALARGKIAETELRMMEEIVTNNPSYERVEHVYYPAVHEDVFAAFDTKDVSVRQNVHDHGVATNIRSNLDALRSKVKATDFEFAKQDVIETIVNLNDQSQAENVLTVLDTLKTHEERETLGLVHAVINQEPDPVIRANMMETLCVQLASGVEAGSVVCKSGRIARMVGALDGMPTSTKNLVPLWIVTNEIGSLAARCRDEGKSPLEFETIALKLYCDDLGYSTHVMGPIVKTYSDAF
jgi:hypothetical protein